MLYGEYDLPNNSRNQIMKNLNSNSSETVSEADGNVKMGSVQTTSMITPKFNHESFKHNNSATKSSMVRKGQETGTNSRSSSFSKLPQVANLPKSERVVIDNKRSNSVAISQLKFAQ